MQATDARLRENAAFGANTATGAPFWAEFALVPGIANVAHTWQAERYHDPDDGSIRYSAGLLETTRNLYSMIEPLALEAIENEATCLLRARGRVSVTPDEWRAHTLSREYLTHCDRARWQARHPGFEPAYRADGGLVEEFLWRWVAQQMFGNSSQVWQVRVEELLIAVENVYALRAALGMEDAPPITLGGVALARERARDVSAESAAA